MGDKGATTHGINWLSCDRTCVEKNLGGLSFRHLYAFNIALIGKQIWKLITSPNTLLCMVLKTKYFLLGNVLDVPLGYNLSLIWSSIVTAKDYLIKQIWKLIISPNTLLFMVLKAKYFPLENVLDVLLGHNLSLILSSIVTTKDYLKSRFCWRIGDGRALKIWHRAWISNTTSLIAESPIVRGFENFSISNLCRGIGGILI